MIIGQARCPHCGYKTTTGGIGEHTNHCSKNPDNKPNSAQPVEGEKEAKTDELIADYVFETKNIPFKRYSQILLEVRLWLNENKTRQKTTDQSGNEPRPPKNNSEDVYRWVKASEILPVGKKPAINTYIGEPGWLIILKDRAIFYEEGKEDDKFYYEFNDENLYKHIQWLEKITPDIK
jgi:hypothetical protein